jgi:hypothetical protein
MNLQEVFKKIEMALTPTQDAAPEVQEEVKVELAMMKLIDGTMLEADEFVAGANVFLVGEDEERVAAPVGEHTLEDGRVLVIEEEGVIAAINEAAEVEAPEVEEEVEVEQAAEEMAYVTKEEFGAAIDELKEMIAGIMPQEEMTAEVEMAVEEPVEVEMAADEAPAAKKVAAAPVEKKPEMHKFATKGRQDALARVMSKLS